MYLQKETEILRFSTFPPLKQLEDKRRRNIAILSRILYTHINREAISREIKLLQSGISGDFRIPVRINDRVRDPRILNARCPCIVSDTNVREIVLQEVKERRRTAGFRTISVFWKTHLLLSARHSSPHLRKLRLTSVLSSFRGSRGG